MDLLAFIHVADPTKVRVVERERVEGEVKLLDSTVGRVVSLLPAALARAESERKASVNKLFNKGGSADQGNSATGDAAAVTAERPKRHRKKRPAVMDASDSSHPPKKLRGDHVASSEVATGGADNRPPMLEKDIMILESVEQGPLIWPSVEVEGVTRLKKYSELSAAKAIQADCDVKATNIILQGLPLEVYALVSTHKVAKELWECIQMLMQGTSLTKQERECKLYDAFDKFAYQKGETLCEFYLKFSLLLNDMNMYNMKLKQFHVNTKFLKILPSEWSKFITDVKLVRDLHTTNVDQLHAYLGQHEYHANEVRLMNERTSDPLALISQHLLNRTPYQHHQPLYQQS
nr:hypothetical protein [Tanacetum cinerariifolium]